MVMAATTYHDPLIVGLSVVIAIVASTAALWIAFTVKTTGQKVASAFVMGLAVCGMHYTAMSGIRIVPNKDIAYVSYSMILANELAGYIVIGTFMVLATSLLATFAIELSPPRAENR
jgi:NO-binding membrane sensor protein with MHYT domain